MFDVRKPTIVWDCFVGSAIPRRSTLVAESVAVATHRAGRVLKVVGSDHESRHGGWQVPNHAPAMACSVLHHDIAGRQQQLRAIVELDDDVAGEKDPEIRRVGPVHAGFVAVLHVHPGEGFWCNHVELWRVRRYDEADATYGWEYAGRRRIVPRVRVGCGLIGAPEEGELSQARDGHRVDLLVSHKNSATLGVVAGDNLAYLHSVSPSRPACSCSPSPSVGSLMSSSRQNGGPRHRPRRSAWLAAGRRPRQPQLPGEAR